MWEDRFKSTIVEGGDALATIAAYIDLNPIRASMVKDPKDYRWSGYGAATGGEKQAQAGLVRVMELSLGEAVFAREMKSGGQRRARTLYRERLLCWGVEQGMQANGQPKKRGMNPEKAAKELAKTGGQLSRAELVRCRVRYFSQGLALGSKGYVEEIFKAMRERFSEKRKDGARRLRGTEKNVVLYALRDLGRVKADN